MLRVQRDERYKVVKLDAVEDREMTWDAKGVHHYLTTRPDGWQFNRTDLVRRTPDGRRVVQGALAELEEAGYLQREPDRKADGTFGGWVWWVSERRMTEAEWEEVKAADQGRLELE